MNEQWRPVSDWPYEVSDLGRVRRVETGRVLRATPDANGYPRVTLRAPGKRVLFRAVHRLVCEAFRGPAPAGMGVLHGDGDKKNCRLSNLRYGTQAENAADSLAHGAHRCGERHPQAVGSDTEIIAALRRARAIGLTAAAKEAGLKYEQLKQISRGANRRYIKDVLEQEAA